jgi:tetratricopeptide (TPR) repeat protein
MTTHRRTGRRPPGRAGPPRGAKRAGASHRGRWVLLTAVLVVIGVGGALILAPVFRSNRQPSAPGARPAEHLPQTTSQTNAKPALTPEEKAAALKEEELRFAEQLVREFPESEEPLVLLGDVYRRRGNTDESVSLWTKGLQRNPRRADIYNRLAQLAFDKDEYEKAISLWRKALEIKPDLGRAHADIARAMMTLGQYRECIAEIQEELKTAPDTPLCYFLLGQAYQHLEDYENARQNYEKVVELEPHHTNAHYGLYTIYARLKETQKAQQHLAEFQKGKERDTLHVRQHDQEATDLHLFARGLARVCVGAHELYLQAGNAAKVEAMLKRAVELDPNNIGYLEKLVALYQGTRRTPEALAVCHRIEQIDPNNAVCQLNIGKLSARMGRPDDAEKALQKVIALLPGHYAGYQELARLYLRTNANLPRARELAQKAAALEPRADSYFVLGWACDVNGDPAGAMSAIQKAIQLDPNNRQYAQLYERIKQREESK